MRSYQLVVANIFFIFLTSCNNKEESNQHINIAKHADVGLTDSIKIIKQVDTIYITNAPSSITRKIRTDSKGNLLFAAFEDIIRYNGRSFKKLNKAPELESFDAFDVLQDNNGDIWIASTHNGIFKYEGNNFKHFTYDDGLLHNRYMCILEDKLGNIWLGSEGGINIYDGHSFKTITKENGLTHNNINTIMEDRTGQIWIGTSGNACIYNPKTSKFTEIIDKDELPFVNVWSIIEDRKGNIWLGAQEGIWRFDGQTFVRMSNIGGICVYEDRYGNIWFTHQLNEPHKSGLSYFSKSSLQKKPKAIEVFKGEGMFFGISEDKDGQIWVGTLQGVFRYNRTSINYFKTNP